MHTRLIFMTCENDGVVWDRWLSGYWHISGRWETCGIWWRSIHPRGSRKRQGSVSSHGSFLRVPMTIPWSPISWILLKRKSFRMFQAQCFVVYALCQSPVHVEWLGEIAVGRWQFCFLLMEFSNGGLYSLILVINPRYRLLRVIEIQLRLLGSGSRPRYCGPPTLGCDLMWSINWTDIFVFGSPGFR